MKKISVIGLGYIGLPTAALLASSGYSVTGMDVNEHAVDTINQGKIHIIEPGLEAVVRSAVSAGTLRAYTELQPGDIYIICVPTPLHEGEKIPRPNIDYVLSATRSIAPLIKAGDQLILESTSPVGTIEQMLAVLLEAGVQADSISLAYCPERVLPGNIMNELSENDRIVGGITSDATRAVADFYRTFVRGNVLETNAKTAEMCKLTENSFRDVNIAFANELSLLCAEDRINVWELIRLANHHPRVNILNPGVGVGGHCIAIDPWFIVSRDKKNSKLIKAAREINNFKTGWVIERIKLAVADKNAKLGIKPKIVCLGLAFKPDIDDLRESPAQSIALALDAEGYDVMAVEPNIRSHKRLNLTSVKNIDWEKAVCVVLVKHKEFVSDDLKQLLIQNDAHDFCGLFES